jgi:ribosome-associated protein
MPYAEIRVSETLCIPDDEIVETASRSRGPGGQHVNKTETRVTLRWSVAASRALSAEQRARLLRALAGRLTQRGELVVRCDRFRSRGRNRDFARQRLAELVRESLRVRTPRIGTRPTRGSAERRLAAKRGRGERKLGRGRVRDLDA